MGRPSPLLRNSSFLSKDPSILLGMLYIYPEDHVPHWSGLMLLAEIISCLEEMFKLCERKANACLEPRWAPHTTCRRTISSLSSTISKVLFSHLFFVWFLIFCFFCLALLLYLFIYFYMFCCYFFILLLYYFKKIRNLLEWTFCLEY